MKIIIEMLKIFYSRLIYELFVLRSSKPLLEACIGLLILLIFLAVIAFIFLVTGWLLTSYPFWTGDNITVGFLAWIGLAMLSYFLAWILPPLLRLYEDARDNLEGG